MKKDGDDDMSFTVQAYGFAKNDALIEVNNALREWNSKGYRMYSIKITTDETPLLTEAELIEQLRNEGVIA